MLKSLLNCGYIYKLLLWLLNINKTFIQIVVQFIMKKKSREQIYKIRISNEERDAINDAAKKLGITTAQYMRASAINRAKRIK